LAAANKFDLIFSGHSRDESDAYRSVAKSLDWLTTSLITNEPSPLLDCILILISPLILVLPHVTRLMVEV